MRYYTVAENTKTTKLIETPNGKIAVIESDTPMRMVVRIGCYYCKLIRTMLAK